MNIKKYITELNRRNVLKAAISYAVFAWVLIQIASIIYPVFGWGPHAIRNTLIILIIGFPLWLVFAYVFEWTSEGFKKTDEVAEETSIAKATSKKMNGIIIAGLSLAVLLLVTDRIFNFTGSTEIDNIDNTDKSIAVLAFADMSQQKDQEYFSDGISEEILNLLAKIPDLKVVSRTSSFSYKGKEDDIKKIGKELNVAHVLEGSIRKAGNTFRITTQLINVANGLHVWSETYDRPIEDIFKIQDEIAAKVTEQLKITLLGDAPTSKTVDTEAYNLYLQAKQLRNQISGESTTNAMKLLKESIAIDSTYAPAWASLSITYYESTFKYVLMSNKEGVLKGKQAAQKAIALNPDLAEGYAVLAIFERIFWNFKEEARLMTKALRLEPNNSQVLTNAAISAISFGKIQFAIELIQKLIELDPLRPVSKYNLALCYLMDGQPLRAEETLNLFLLLHPASGSGNGLMGQIQLRLGNPDKAAIYLDKETDPFWNSYRKCMVLYALGQTKEANELLKQFVAEYGVDSWPNIAHVHAFRGEREETFKWLELAFENKDASLLEILNYPEMKNLWGDPRWNKFIDKLSLPADHGFHRD